MNGWSESLRRELLLDVRVTLIEPGAVATDLPTHITHGETRQGVEQLYSHIEVTADDIAKVIAFVIGRPRRLAIHEEVLLRQPVRSTDGRPSCPASAAVEEAKGTAGNGRERGRERRGTAPTTADTPHRPYHECPVSPAHRAPCGRGEIVVDAARRGHVEHHACSWPTRQRRCRCTRHVATDPATDYSICQHSCGPNMTEGP
jgi:hypothetical protein